MELLGKLSQVMAAAHAEFQQLVKSGTQFIAERVAPITAFLAVLFGRADYGPEVGQIIVQSNVSCSSVCVDDY